MNKDKEKIIDRLGDIVYNLAKMKDEHFNAIFTEHNEAEELLCRLEELSKRASGRTTHTLTKVLEWVEKCYTYKDIPALIVWEFPSHLMLKDMFYRLNESIPKNVNVRACRGSLFIDFPMIDNVVRIKFINTGFDLESNKELYPYMYRWDRVVVFKDHTMFQSPHYWEGSEYKDGKVFKWRDKI